jgi:phage tail protein X
VKQGDDIIYVRHPGLFGVGRIVRVLPNGRLRIRFPDDDFQEFDAQELELWDVWRDRKKAAA